MTEQSPNDTDAIALRDVLAEDEAFLYDVYLSTRREEMAAWGWDDAQQQMFARMQFNLRRQAYLMQYPEAVYKIIMSGLERAGSLIIERRPEEIRLVDIALLPEYHNRGIGRFLVKQLFAEADAAGKIVRLHVQKENSAARRFYERLGFSITEENDTHFRMERYLNGGGRNGA